MNDNLKKLFRLDVVFNILAVYLNIIINFYFWESSKSLQVVMFYNLLYSIFGFGCYVLGSYLLFKSIKAIYYISAVSAISLSLILYNSDFFEFTYLLVLVAFFSSLVVAVFYSATNYLLSSYTENKEETRIYFNKIGIFNNFIFILVPVINGILISIYSFKVSFVFLGVASVIYLLAVISIKGSKLEYTGNFASFIKRETKKQKFSKPVFQYIVFGGLAFQLIAILQPVVMSVVSKNSVELSILNAVIVVMLVGCFIVIKRYSKVRGSIWYMFYIIFFVIANVSLFLPFAASEFVYLFFLAIGIYLFKFVFNVYPFEELNGVEPTKKQMLLLKREFYLFVGRLIMLVLAVVMLKEIGDPAWIFLNSIIFTISIGVYFIVLKIEKKPR